MSLKKWIGANWRSLDLKWLFLLSSYFVKCSRGVEFIRTTSKFRKRKKILSSLVYHVYVLHKTWQINRAFSRRSRAVRVKKCTKKCVVRCRVVVLLIKNLLLFFLRSRCRRRRRTLSRDLINDDEGNGNMKKAMGLIRKTTTLNVHHAFL